MTSSAEEYPSLDVDVETPVLFDATIDGRPRKLLAQAARCGYFFVLDRTNEKNLVAQGFVGVNWSKGVDAKGQAIPDPAKIDGSLVKHSRGRRHELASTELQS